MSSPSWLDSSVGRALHWYCGGNTKQRVPAHRKLRVVVLTKLLINVLKEEENLWNTFCAGTVA